MSNIAENLRAVQDRINAAAARSGRKLDDITLIAVSKTRSADEIRQAVSCGVTDLGENYVQEAEVKYGELGDTARWHMIGHLQRNKARHAVKCFEMIHSVESEDLAVELGKRAQAAGKCQDVLVEVRISGEDTKFGVEPGDVLPFVDRISQVSGIRACGLMGMAPFVEDPEQTRPYFARLKQLWDRLPEEQRIYLSMGMTQDFEVAIEEGANMVRIGTAIFGPRA